MPEILADQQTCPSEAGIKRPDPISPGKEPSFIKQTIGRQIHFVVHVENASPGEIGGGDEKAVTIVFIHEADHEVYVLTRLEEMFKDRVLFPRSVRDRGDKILDDVPC